MAQAAFKRGDLVRFTDRQGVVLNTHVVRVAIIAGQRYYKVAGAPLLTADGLEPRDAARGGFSAEQIERLVEAGAIPAVGPSDILAAADVEG